MKRMIKISLILLLLGMAVIAAVPFLKEKEAERKSENGFKEIQESVTENNECDKTKGRKQGLHWILGSARN